MKSFMLAIFYDMFDVFDVVPFLLYFMCIIVNYVLRKKIDKKI